jgi:hypothetical protein
MAVSSSKMLQIAWKMVRTGNPKKIPQTKKKIPKQFPTLFAIHHVLLAGSCSGNLSVNLTANLTANRSTNNSREVSETEVLNFSGNRWAAVVSLNHWLDLVGGFKIRKHVVST